MNGPRSGQSARPAGDDAVACTACRASNRPHRGYCRECGAALAPVCRGCRFVNERGDQFCGGCGSPLAELPGAAMGDVAAGVRAAPPASAAAGAPARPGAARAARHDASAALRGDSELAALLAPLTAAAPKDELPQANITQADLDRLFGGTS